jgi:hypothetical protein
MQPRIGILLASTALLAAGVSSMAVAAQNPTAQPECYSICSSDARLTQEWTSVAEGREEFQVFHVRVSPAVLGLEQAPTGTVEIKSGSTILCAIVLSDGRGSCSPSPNALPAGFHSVRGYYSGDAAFSASVSNDKTFEVTSV